MSYDRDMIGYGDEPPRVNWPGGARVAVQFVLNYEEGGENCVLHGDAASETFLSEIIGAQAFEDARHMSLESIYEFGSRAGVWRILDLFSDQQVPLTVFAVAMAAERNPAVIERALKDGHEIASHGLRWIDYHHVDEHDERVHIHQAAERIQRLTGIKPVGWMTGRPGPNTRRLLVEHGGFHYDRDALNDELPYWVTVGGMPHLVIPYSYETNDNRCDQSNGFAQSDDFFQYMRDAFDLLHEEGADRPGLLSIGLHDRLIGRPARAVGLIKLLEYMQDKGDVWFCSGADIASHWRKTHPYQAPA